MDSGLLSSSSSTTDLHLGKDADSSAKRGTVCMSPPKTVGVCAKKMQHQQNTAMEDLL